MKKKIILLLIACNITVLKAQLINPVKWSYAAKRTDKNEAVIYIKATIDQGWHIYSQFIEPGGPTKTTIGFLNSKDFTLIGKVIEPKPIIQYEDTFRMDLSYFEKSVVFQQRIKLARTKTFTIKGAIEFMACNDDKCLPPDVVNFSIPVK